MGRKEEKQFCYINLDQLFFKLCVFVIKVRQSIVCNSQLTDNIVIHSALPAERLQMLACPESGTKRKPCGQNIKRHSMRNNVVGLVIGCDLLLGNIYEHCLINDEIDSIVKKNAIV